MAKKKTNTASLVFLVAAVLGIAAILLMFAPGVTMGHKVAKETSSFSGFKIMFGGELANVQGFSVGELKFNFVAFLAFVFTLVGIAGVLLSLLLKGKIGGFLAIGGFLLAGIFYFLFNATFSINLGEKGSEAIELMENLGATFSLGIGAIIAGICSIVAALASAAAAFAIKK